MPDIEISIDVDILAGINFWVDAEHWASLNDEGKRTHIGTVADSIAAELSNDVIHFRAGNLSAEIIGPEDNKIVLSQVRIYDPEDRA